MQLTHDNYFTPENKYLSNSKLKDFLKCKNYFYRKHVLGTVDKTSSKALTTGSAVDELLTDIGNAINGKYAVRQFNGTTKEGKAEKADLEAQGKTILTQAEYDEIMGIAIAVSETSAYKDLATHKTQSIISIDMPIGIFPGLAGIPDWYDIKDGLCVITDLKTSRTVDEKEYYYHSKRYGYFFQQAVYQYILSVLHPEIDLFVSRHLVVNKEKDIYSVKAFVLDQDEIEREKVELQRLLLEVANEVEFKKEDADWKTATTLRDPRTAEFYNDEE